jgi:hypothetical protein
VSPQQRLQDRRVESPFGQGVVQAAPPAAVCRLQAQVWQRGDRTSRQEGIDQLKQGVGASPEAAMETSAKGTESCEVMGGHGAQLARMAGRWPTQPTTTPPWVKSQA